MCAFVVDLKPSKVILPSSVLLPSSPVETKDVRSFVVFVYGLRVLK